MAIFFIERASFVIANATIEPFFGRIEQKHALSGSFYQRHPIDYKIFIFLGQPPVSTSKETSMVGKRYYSSSGSRVRKLFPSLNSERIKFL